MPSHAPPQTGSASPGPPAARPIAISVEDVSKSFRLGAEPSKTLKDRLLTFGQTDGQVVQALADVAFGVRQGECFGILGHNGSGKSTLLKIMAGTIRPTDGRVRVRGRLAALLELGAGFHPDLSGRENVYLNASILGFEREHVDAIFADIVEFAELEDFIDLQVKFYSSGMTARLGFAVATNLEPDVLLVDEVLAVGDEAFQLKCMERVHRFRAMGRTMVIVSHGPERIRELCDRALVLERGRMLHVGEVDEAVEIYRAALHDLSHRSGPSRAALRPTGVVEDLDGDVPPVQLLDGRVIDAAAEVPFAPGETVRIVIRYRLRQPVDHRIRLALRSDDNAVMMNRSTSDVLDGPLPDQPGDYELSFTIDDLPLLSGTYRFAFVAETPDASHVWDRIIPPTGEFTVRGPDPAFGRVAVKIAGELSPVTELDLEPLGEGALQPGEDLEPGDEQHDGNHGRDGQVLQVPGGRP